MAIHTFDQFCRQHPRITKDLILGDILLFKFFPDLGETDWRSMQGKRIFKKDIKDENIKSIQQGKKPFKGVTKHLGSKTSVHAAIVVNDGKMAEAGAGTCKIDNWVGAREHILVYRCKKEDLRIMAVEIAERLANRSGYTLKGAIGSVFRTRTFEHNAWDKRHLPSPTEKYLNNIILYCFERGTKVESPDFFCSEFVITCYEAASMFMWKKTAFGSNPRAVTPMELENILNSRPDLFECFGRIESRAHILRARIKVAVIEYEESLGGLKGFFHLRKQSEASKEALFYFKKILDMDPRPFGLLLFAVEHFMTLVALGDSKIPIEEGKQNFAQELSMESPLNRDSTFYKLIAKNLRGANIFKIG